MAAVQLSMVAIESAVAVDSGLSRSASGTITPGGWRIRACPSLPLLEELIAFDQSVGLVPSQLLSPSLRSLKLLDARLADSLSLRYAKLELCHLDYWDDNILAMLGDAGPGSLCAISSS